MSDQHPDPPHDDPQVDDVLAEEQRQMTEHPGPPPVHSEAEAAEIEEETFEDDA